ncbi:unnamed protein product, partial [Discosporangium mesarthrocarpum]
MLYIAGFSLGFGAVAWVVLAEIVPSRVRSRAYGLFISVNWAANLAVGLLTLTAIQALGDLVVREWGAGVGYGGEEDRDKVGVATLYLIFGSVCVVALAYIHRLVPETMGTS